MTLTDFRAMFPEISISDYPDAYVTIWLNYALEAVNADLFGSEINAYNITVGNLAAHMTVVDDNAMTTTQSVGAMRVTYGDGEDKRHYQLTAYGRVFVRMSKLYGAGGLCV